MFSSFFGKAEARAYWRDQAVFAAFTLAVCVAAWFSAGLVTLGGVPGLVAKGAITAVVSGAATLAVFRNDVAAVVKAARGRKG